MGYTHYFTHKSERKAFTKGQLASLEKVLDYWQNEGVICYEYNQPNDPYLLNSTTIRFNGKGEDGHETFYFALGKKDFNFCKTARKGYDQCVCEVLILLREYLGEKLELGSDGDIFPRHPDDEWYSHCKDHFNEEWKPAWDRLKEEGFKITWGDPEKMCELEGEWVDAVAEKEFIIPVTWTMGTDIRVKAASLDDAIAKVEELEGLPSDGSYMDDSFEVNIESAEDLNNEDDFDIERNRVSRHKALEISAELGNL